MPVLSNKTVSTSFISSRARPSLTRIPLLAQRASEESMARGAAMRMPVPKSLLSTATAPAGPIAAMPDRAHRQRRDHGLVGQSLALVLRAQLVAGGIVQDLADLGRCRLVARFLDLDQDLAGDHQGRGEDPIADPFLGGGRLARQGMLIDHRHALGDDPVDRDDLAGVNHDHVQRLESIERDLDLGAVAVQPDVTGLFAEGVQEQLLGIVLRLLDQDPAEAEAPAQDRARERSPWFPDIRPRRSRRARRRPAASRRPEPRVPP